MNEEREQRLRRLSSKISASQAAKLPERSTKLAYVAGSLKGGHMKKHSKEFSSIGEKRKELIGIYIQVESQNFCHYVHATKYKLVVIMIFFSWM